MIAHIDFASRRSFLALHEDRNTTSHAHIQNDRLNERPTVPLYSLIQYRVMKTRATISSRSPYVYSTKLVRA